MKKYPFKIVNAKAKIGENIKYMLQEIGQDKKRLYLLAIENLKKEKGSYSDTIILETTGARLPDIQIRVLGNILGREKTTNRPV